MHRLKIIVSIYWNLDFNFLAMASEEDLFHSPRERFETELEVDQDWLGDMIFKSSLCRVSEMSIPSFTFEVSLYVT